MGKFKATRKSSGDEVVLFLEGVLDSSIQFEELVGAPPRRLIVDCSRIYHANSSLVKVWKEYFGGLTRHGTEVIFQECATPIIEYMNVIEGFSCGGRIRSVLAPFYCRHCRRSLDLLVLTEDPAQVTVQLRSQRCTSCFRDIDFDDDPREFFGFMERT